MRYPHAHEGYLTPLHSSLRLLLLGAAALCIADSAVADDFSTCMQAVTAGGVFKTYQSASGQHVYKTAREWLCSSDFVSASQSSSAGGSADTPWGTGNYNQNDASQSAARTKFCQDNSSSLSDSQVSYVAIQDGDLTVQKEVEACIGMADRQAARDNQTYLEVTAAPLLDGTFDVKVSAKNYPGGQPLMVSQKVLGTAATAVDVGDLSAGAVIPFDGSGIPPITGTYQFAASTPMARVKVETSIGSATVEAHKCPQGVVGKWAVAQDVEVDTQTSSPWSDSRNIPTASCHPHCKQNQGDHMSFNFAVDANSTLEHYSAHYSGGGSSFDGDPSVTRPSPNVLHVEAISRSDATTLEISATKVTTTKSEQHQTGSPTDITAGQLFSVSLGENVNAELLLTGVDGSVTSVTGQQLQTGNVPDWVTISGTPTSDGHHLTANLRDVMPASCH